MDGEWLMTVKAEGLPGQLGAAYLCTPQSEVVRSRTEVELIGRVETVMDKMTVCVLADAQVFVVPTGKVLYMAPVRVR